MGGDEIKNIHNNILALLFGCILSFIFLESTVRIFDPLPSRVKGNQIILKANLTKRFKLDPPIPGLGDVITHKVNSLGFRGDEPPDNISDYYTILTVGGSTTECSLLSEGQTWTDILGRQLKIKYRNIWINNAGMDGMSTYGHLILLKDYIVDLEPDMILFLVGANDKAKANFEDETGILFSKDEFWLRTLLKKSELLLFLNNVRLSYMARSVNLGHLVRRQYNVIENKDVDDTLQKELNRHKAYYVETYRHRLEELIARTVENHIKPVLITQPHRGPPKSRNDRIMELYNNVTREIAIGQNIRLIDLALELEDTDENYYDGIHFTVKGAESVASIIYTNLSLDTMLLDDVDVEQHN